MEHLIKAFDDRPLVRIKDRNYIINPLTDHTPTTSYELLEDTVVEMSKLTDFSKANKIVGEEDRGGFIAALLAYKNKLPLGMVKWNPSGLDGQFEIEFRNAYTDGKMFLHGVESGDKVIIVEDMVDSGGTLISMLQLLQKANVEIIDVIVIAEKEEYKGIERIKNETGIEVKHILKFSSTGEKSKVTWVYNQNI